jgi:PAS domain S-box-containing protein
MWTSFAASNQWSIHTHQVLEKVESLLSEMKDAETGQRGYLLTGDDRYLEPYNTALQAMPGEFQELRNLTSDNPRQQSRFENLRSLIDAKLAELKETIAVRRTQGADQAVKIVSTGRGKQLMDRIRVVIQAMRADELSLLDRRNQETVDRARLLILMMTCGAAFLLIVLLAGSHAIDRGITARALAQAAEKTQREWLQVVLSSIGDGVIATDGNGRVTLINPVAAQLTGWSPQIAQGQPLETVFTILNEETGNKVENPALRAIRDRTIVGLANHTILICRDGKRIPLDDSGAPIVDASGNVLGAVLIFRDVSEKKRREADLVRRDRMLRFSFDAILITDAQRRIQSWNRGACDLYGWDEAEVRDKIVCDFLRTSPPIALVDAVLLQQGQWRGELLHTCKDGRAVNVESRQVLLRDKEGGIDGVLEINRDITERKRTEEALRESEERHRVLADTMLQGVVHQDADGKIVAMNPAAERILGWTREEFLGSSSVRVERDTIREDGSPFPGLEHPAMIALRTGRPLQGVVMGMFNPREGAHRWISVAAVPLFRPAAASPSQVYTVFEDITERKRAEETLRQSEESYRTLFSTMIEGFCIIEVIFDAEGRPVDYRFLEINPAFEARTGLKNARGRLMRELAPEHEAHWFEIYGRVAQTGQPARFVNEARALNRWYDVSAYRVGGDRSRQVAILFNDITERRQAEEALAASENRLRALLESASQGVVAVDESGRIVLVNAKTEEMFGYTRDELLGQSLDFMLPERYRKAHGEHLRHYFAHPRTRVMGLGIDLYGRSKNGHEFPLEVSLSCTEQGGSRLAMALVTDITERKRSEERLRQAQKLESLGLLAGGVAHDFNNLLVGVIGNASLAQEMLPPDNLAVELLEGVVKSGQQAAHLTRQMLAYSGKGKFLVEPLDLSALVPEMCGLVRPSIPKKIELRLDLDPDLPAVEADRGQVQQVFMNLVLNAGEAIGSRDGLISVRTYVDDVDEAYLRLRSEAAALRPGKYVCLEVRDTGSGMDEATKAKIFDPFFTTKFTGRGLGLAAVSGIMRGHKGAITVGSAPGKGSCFTALFPAVEQAVKESPVPARKDTLQGAGVVLVVDDEHVVREIAKKALERQGYTVLLADSGLAAIDMFGRHAGEIALVVLDLSMPHMGGEEALVELRKIRPEVKVVVSSGYSEAETMTLFHGQRVSGFIQKPYTSTELAEKVKVCAG